MGIMIVVLPLIAVAVFYVISAGKMARSYRIEDLPLVLRSVNIEQLERLLDPGVEADLRRGLSSKAFRGEQVIRLRSAMEQARRLSHNAAILACWANEEFERNVTQKNRGEFTTNDHSLMRVIQTANQLRWQTLAMMLKIGIWRGLLVSRIFFLPVPSVTDLREAFGRDLLDTYQAMTSAAGQLGLSYGEREYEQLLAAL
jgi:hypothetical protein